MRKLLNIIVLVLVPLVSYAQHTQRASGSYTYVIPDDESLAEAQQKALNLCRIKILADNFGTSITSTEFSQIGMGEDRFLHIAESEVNGEWLRTIGEPTLTKALINNNFVITVSVTGDIRKIERAQVDFLADTYRDASKKGQPTTEFRSGENLYLNFRSPVKGYLLVFMADTENAYCLLPYPQQSAGSIQVKAKQDYMFFSNEYDYDGIEIHDIESIVLTSAGDIERDKMYVVFSPNEFTKPVFSHRSGRLEALSFRDFQKWLFKARQQDKKLTVKEIDITIKL